MYASSEDSSIVYCENDLKLVGYDQKFRTLYKCLRHLNPLHLHAFFLKDVTSKSG